MCYHGTVQPAVLITAGVVCMKKMRLRVKKNLWFQAQLWTSMCSSVKGRLSCLLCLTEAQMVLRKHQRTMEKDQRAWWLLGDHTHRRHRLIKSSSIKCFLYARPCAKRLLTLSHLTPPLHMYEVGVNGSFSRVAPETEITKVTYPRACMLVARGAGISAGGEHSLWA